MGLKLIAKQKVIILSIHQAVEWIIIYEHFFWNGRATLYFIWEMGSILKIISKQKMCLSLVVKYSIMYLLIKKSISQVKCYLIIVHILQKGNYEFVFLYLNLLTTFF